MKLYGRWDDPRTITVRAVANLASGGENNLTNTKSGDQKSCVEFVPVGVELKKGLSFSGKLPVLYVDEKIVAFSANACVGFDLDSLVLHVNLPNLIIG